MKTFVQRNSKPLQPEELPERRSSTRDELLEEIEGPWAVADQSPSPGRLNVAGIPTAN
jgi:hypothetical protein